MGLKGGKVTEGERLEALYDRYRRRRKDWDGFLQMLVRLANEVNAERLVDLTLLVP
jgi:hypothetical protein